MTAPLIRALYIDDEPALLEVTKAFLELDGGIELSVMESGADALRYLNEGSCDAIVSDYQMPDMDGIQLLKALKDRGDRTPFILFTGKGREEVAIEAINNGADFYLQKGGDPKVQFRELKNAIIKLAQKSRTEKALQESERKYRELVESANSIILRVDVGGRVRFINEFAQTFFGYTSEEIVGRSIIGTIVPPVDDEGKEAVRSIDELVQHHLENPSTISQNVKRNGERVWIAWTNRVILDEGGRVREVLSIGANMTALHHAEAALREREEKLRLITDNMKDVITEIDLVGTIRYSSPSVRTVLGYGPETRVGVDCLALVHPEDRDRMRGFLADALKKGPMNNIEFRYLSASGDYLWLETVGSIVRGPAGEVKGFVLSSRDITERKEVEHRLMDSEYLLRQTQSAAHIGGYHIDLVRGTSEWTDEAFRICGIDPIKERSKREEYLKLVIPQDRELVEQAWWDEPEKEVNLDFVYRLMTPDGRLRYIHNRSKIEVDDRGEVLGIFGTIMDETDLKDAEQRLRESQALLAEAQRLSRTGSYRYDLTTGEVRWSEGMFHLSGRDPAKGEPAMEEYWSLVHPEDRPYLRSGFRKAIDTPGPFDLTYRTITPTGDRIVESVGNVMTAADGTPSYLIGTLTDVTEKHRVEEERRRMERKFRDIFDGASDIILIMEPSGRLLEANAMACQRLGYDRAELLECRLHDIIDPILQGSLDHLLDRIVHGGELLTESRHVCKGGLFIPVEVSCKLIELEGRQAILAMARDITERRDAERRLRESQRLLAEAERASRMGSYRVHWKPPRQQFSEELFCILGLDPEKDKPSMRMLHDLVHPDDRPAMQTAIDRVAKDKMEVDIEYRVVLGDGTIKYLRNKVRPEIDRSGELEGLFGTLMDVTERKRAEKAAKLADLKLALLGDITRHDVQNKVTALSGYLQLAEMRASEPGAKEMVAKARQVALSIDHQMSFAREYSTLGQSEARWIVLADACAKGVANLDLGRLMLRVDLDRFEVFADPMLEKVFHNLVENTIRYGRTASAVRIAASADESGLRIVCEDNGVGIAEPDKGSLFEWEFHSRRGHGLHLIKEILLLSGISIKETGRPGEGAHFVIEVPHGRYRVRAEHHAGERAAGRCPNDDTFKKPEDPGPSAKA